MAPDKTDKTNLTPIARLAALEVESDWLLELLGGELDIFSILGLGFGASERAKELVLKGLLAEQMNILEARAKRGRGRPRKDFLNRDIERAAAVLGADDLWRDKTGSGAPTQKAAIGLAIQIDEIVVTAGVRHSRLFGTSFARLQTSVSKGLADLGQTKRFSNK